MHATRFPARLLLASLCLAGALRADEPAAKRPMEIADLFRFVRVADPQISPDGRDVVWQATTVNPEANGSSTALWIAPADGSTPPRPLTVVEGTAKDSRPRYSPDGSRILFQSTRGGTSQLWVVPSAGGAPVRLTEISTGAEDAAWSPDGTALYYVRSDDRWADHEFMRIPRNGGAAVVVATDKDLFDYGTMSPRSQTGYPLVSPDGKWLLF